MRFIRSLMITFAVALSTAPAVLWGGDLGSGVSKLFDLGMESTPSAAAAAKAQFEQLKRDHPNDRRIDYAYGVALIRQRSYRDAVPLISRYLAAGKAEPDTYCTQIWAQIQDRNYRGALEQANALAAHFATRSKTAPEPKYYEAAEFLGTVFAFLELARPAAVKAEARLEHKNRILACLGTAYIRAFDNGRAEVAKQFAELEEKRAAQERLAAAKVDHRKADAKTVLASDHGKLLDQQETVQSTTEQLRESQREFNLIQSELGSLRLDRGRLQSQIVVIQTLITQLQPDYFTMPPASQQRPTDLGKYAQVFSLTIELAALGKQAAGMDRKILGYQSRAAVLSNKGERETEVLAQSDAEIAAIRQRSKSAEYQLSRRDKSTVIRSGVLSDKMAMLSTYSPFPYSQERQRVLGWFPK